MDQNKNKEQGAEGTGAKFKHTPEPWTYKNGYIIQGDYNDNYGYPIGHVDHPRSDFPSQEIEANAKRIVECVNAMQGINEPQKLRETWENNHDLMHDAYRIMKEQRDELLAALEGIKEFVDPIIARMPPNPKFKLAWNLMNLAINNAKGGQTP